MMIDTPVVRSLSQSFGGLGGTEVPDMVLPVVQLVTPLGAVASAAVNDLFGVQHSIQASRSINHGVSTAPQTADLIIFDRGVYRIVGMIMAMSFGGIVASSASIVLAHIGLSTPSGAAIGIIAKVPIGANGVAVPLFYDVTVNLNLVGWRLRLQTVLTTGAGESIGAEATANVSRIL